MLQNGHENGRGLIFKSWKVCLLFTLTNGTILTELNGCSGPQAIKLIHAWPFESHARCKRLPNQEAVAKNIFLKKS